MEEEMIDPTTTSSDEGKENVQATPNDSEKKRRKLVVAPCWRE